MVIKSGEIAERILKEEKRLSATEKRELKKAVKSGEWAKKVAKRYEETDRRKALDFQREYK